MSANNRVTIIPPHEPLPQTTPEPRRGALGALLMRIGLARRTALLEKMSKMSDAHKTFLTSHEALYKQAALTQREIHRYQYDLSGILASGRQEAEDELFRRETEGRTTRHIAELAAIEAEFKATTARFGLDAFRAQVPFREIINIENAKLGQFQAIEKTTTIEDRLDTRRGKPGPAQPIDTTELERRIADLEASLQTAVGSHAPDFVIQALSHALDALKSLRPKAAP